MTGGRMRIAIEAVDIDIDLADERTALKSLSSLELASPALRAAPKRRRDYLAGRLAARRALASLLGGRARDLSVTTSKHARAGEPFVVDRRGAAAPYVVSISHAAGLAVACAGSQKNGPIGIDLEVVEDRGAAFAEEAFAPGELATWAAALGRPIDEAWVSTAAWVTKEAILKYDGVGLRVPLRSRSVARLEAADEPLSETTGGAPLIAALRWWRAYAQDGRAFALGLFSDAARALAVAHRLERVTPG